MFIQYPAPEGAASQSNEPAIYARPEDIEQADKQIALAREALAELEAKLFAALEVKDITAEGDLRRECRIARQLVWNLEKHKGDMEHGR